MANQVAISTAQCGVEFLTCADDILSRLLLDYAVFDEPKDDGRRTLKFNLNRRTLRSRAGKEEAAGTEEDDVCKLVKKIRSGTLSVNDALDTLLQFPSVRNFVKKWDDAEEPEAMFANHAKRYILALRPDCGVAFHETDRYTNPRGVGAGPKKRKLPAAVAERSKKDLEDLIEVGVFATRAFKKGEVINLRGGVAELSDEQDDELRGGKDRSEFSVLWSERKNCFCLLLGPACRVNHDCRNNVEFQLTGANMSFKVVEDIDKDAELFTHYGEHYFERDNASCLCATCEQHSRGAFTPPAHKPGKEPKKPARRASSPTRRSSRAVAEVNYDENAPIASTSSGSGHALTAQRSVRSGLSRSSPLSSPSSLSSSAFSTPKRDTRARPTPARANPSRISQIDIFRSQPRTVVQPKLKPPPGYLHDYKWDSMKRTATYKGPKVSSVGETGQTVRKPSASSSGTGMTRSASAPSNLSLGRTRGRNAVSNSPQLKGKGRAREDEGSPRPKKVRKAPAPFKPVRQGERTSSRVKEVQRRREIDEMSDLSELEDSEEEALVEGVVEKKDGGAEESELTEVEEGSKDSQEEDAVVEAMLSPRSLSPRRSTGQRSSLGEDERNLPFRMPGLPQASSTVAVASTTASASPSAEPASTATASITLSSAPAPLPRSRHTRSSTSQISHISSSTAGGMTGSSDVVMSTSTPIEEYNSPQLRCESAEGAKKEKKEDDKGDEADEEDQIVLVSLPSTSKGVEPQEGQKTPTRRSSPRKVIGAGSFYFSASVGGGAEDGGGGAGGGSGGASSSTNGQQDFRQSPSGDGGKQAGSASSAASATTNNGGGGMQGGGGGSGDGGDGGRDGKGGGRREGPVDRMDVNGEQGEKEGEEEEEQKPKIVVEEEGEMVNGMEQALPVGGQVEGDVEESAAALLMLFRTAPSNPSSARTPSSTAPTPPHNDSFAASTSTDASAPAPSSKKGKRQRVSEEHQPSPPAPSNNPRSTRRQPKLVEPEVEVEVVVEPEQEDEEVEPEKEEVPVASSSATRVQEKPKPKKARTSASPAVLDGPSSSRSRRFLGRQSPAATESKPTPEARRTRSNPLAGKLGDVLSAPETLAALGGYDYEKGRYITKHEALRKPSNDPRPPARPSSSPSPPPPSRAKSAGAQPKPSLPAKRPRKSHSPAPLPHRNSAPVASSSRSTPLVKHTSARRNSSAGPSTPAALPEGVRATRKSFPIAGSLKDFIYSPAVLAASGGWDEEKGAYVSSASASHAAADSPAAPPSSSLAKRRASSSSAAFEPSSSSSNCKGRTLSASPAAAAVNGSSSSSAPPEGVRSTRRSFPMAGTKLQDLVYGDAAVTGGWNGEKYVSAASAQKALAAAAAAGSGGGRG
ncbi:hypothetical protein JCM8547_003491 [Rhodosporidiobolus lusitaniae]